MGNIQENNLYTHPGNILTALQRQYKSKEWNIDDIIELCAQCEKDYIGDIQTMVQFQEIGIPVIDGMAKLPCNIFRLEDIYDEGSQILYAANNGAYLYSIRSRNNNPFTGDTIYLNYSGMPVDEEGVPLIAAGHEPACETFCKIKLFEEDVALGKFDGNFWNMLDQKLSGQISSAQNSWRHMTRADIDRRHIIRGNMLQRIGQLELKHKEFS